MSYYILNKYKPFFTEGVSVVYLGFLNIHILCAGGDSAEGLLYACRFQSNRRKLTRDKLLMKHTSTFLLTLSDNSLGQLGLGEQGQKYNNSKLLSI